MNVKYISDVFDTIPEQNVSSMHHAISVFEDNMKYKVTRVHELFPKPKKGLTQKHLEFIARHMVYKEDYDNNKHTIYKQFLKSVVVPDDAKIIVIGDIHGKISGLKQLIHDLISKGYMTQRGILAHNVYLVSLGDLIDYGNKSLHVLYIMLKLRALNNQGTHEKVFLLCGNHEGDISDELSGKDRYSSQVRGYNEANKETQHKLLKATQYLGPYMLSIRYQNDNSRFCMMHGMYPVTSMPTSFKGDNYVYKIWDGKTFDQTCANEMLYTACQWNDLSSHDDTLPSFRVHRASQVGFKHVLEICNLHQIKMFIRGHQDWCPTQYGFYNNCEDTIVSNVSKVSHPYDHDNMKCKKGVFPKCTNKDDPHIISGLPENLEEVRKRVYTTSMAYAKNNSYTSFSAYVLIENNERRGENVFTYPPYVPISEPNIEKQSFWERFIALCRMDPKKAVVIR